MATSPPYNHAELLEAIGEIQTLGAELKYVEMAVAYSQMTCPPGTMGTVQVEIGRPPFKIDVHSNYDPTGRTSTESLKIYRDAADSAAAEHDGRLRSGILPITDPKPDDLQPVINELIENVGFRLNTAESDFAGLEWDLTKRWEGQTAESFYKFYNTIEDNASDQEQLAIRIASQVAGIKSVLRSETGCGRSW